MLRSAPRQLLRSMQQFVLEENLDILCSEDEIELEELIESARDEIITSMLRIHQANSTRKWSLMIKNAKMEKSDLTLTYVQYVEDF